ncbi:MAG TPA: hypothetical protein VFQ67_04445 [Allosphingosinicella sp.]|jgi:hypothetical protein|nr:hypothetical protein [Allosphingosinicella sp.]
MQDILTDTLAIVVACLAVAGLAGMIVLFRPAARRRRRHKRHSRRPRIDLFEPAQQRGGQGDA